MNTDGTTYCYYTKRDLTKRDYTTFGAYYGVLTAGAIFAAVQLYVLSPITIHPFSY
jgi:hypothetical protein